MDSSMIGKIAKAKQYANEAMERVTFRELRATVRGDHSTHLVTYQDGQWGCDCRHFQGHGLCSHIMTLERVLGTMVSPQTPEAPLPSAA